MVEKIIVNPESVRGYGNIVDPKIVEYYDCNNCELVEDTVQINGAELAAYDLNYIPGSQIPTIDMIINSSSYVNTSVNIRAALFDEDDRPVNGYIAFFCNEDCITNGQNTGSYVNYVQCQNGQVSFNYSFDTEGTYTIRAVSLQDNIYVSASISRNIQISKRTTGFDASGCSDTINYSSTGSIFVRLAYDNVAIENQEYVVKLNGTTLGTYVSLANGETISLSGLLKGTNTLELIYYGTNEFTPCSETIIWHNSYPVTITISATRTARDASARIASYNLNINMKHEGEAIEGMPFSVQGSGPNGMVFSFPGLSTDSNGNYTLPMSGMPFGNYTFSVQTSDYGNYLATSKNYTLKVQ